MRLTHLLLALVLLMPFAWAERQVTINKFETGYSNGLPASGDYNAIAIADVDGDTYLDMAFGGDDYGSASTTGLYVYRGFGNGTWVSASTGLPTADSWGGVAFGDADGDGRMELYAGNEGWGSDSGTIKGVGAWEYSAGSWSQTGISSPLTTNTVNDVVLRNFTKGAGLDIALSHSTPGGGIKVYYGSGSSPITWTSFSTGLPTSGEYTGIAIGDLNNDGLPDLVSGSYSGSGLKVYTQGSTGWTDRSSSLPSGYTSVQTDSVNMGDIDNDGDQDIIVSSSSSGLKLLLGNGGGSDGISFSWTDVTSNLPTSLKSSRLFQTVLKDIDEDGDLDLLAPKQSSGLHLYLGNGSVASGTSFRFTEVTGKGLPTNGVYVGAALFDLDKDTDLDIAGSTWGQGVKVFNSNFTIVDTDNTAPVARATGGGTFVLGNTIPLRGNTSSDAEDAPAGDPSGTLLTYNWTVTSRPAGSNASDDDLLPSDTSANVQFSPDRAGSYNVTLQVRDSRGKWSNKVVVNVRTTNRYPVSDAGENFSVMIGAMARLNGSGSNDPDGHDIDYDWDLITYPAGSAVRDGSLSPSDRTAEPTFVPDVPGRYIFELVVDDGFGYRSAPDRVTVTGIKPNERPIADAGKAGVGYVNHTVTLDGSMSRDPDGLIVDFNWTCTTHPVVLDNVSMPSFVPMETGAYSFTLVVEDDNGTLSEPDSVMITVVGLGENLPPVADAGFGGEYVEGEIVDLDGTGSYDLDGEITGWEWTSDPQLEMNGTDGPTPFFVAVPGSFNITLRVRDDNETWSSPDTINILVTAVHVNEPPVAVAGGDITVDEGAEVSFDGSASYDPDGTIISYLWECEELDLDIADIAFEHTFEEPGNYTFSLVVTDDEGADSLPDLVKITVEEIIVIPPPPVDRNITVWIGPILREDGTEAAGLTVIMSSGGWSWTNVTNAEGKAGFRLEPGEYSLTVIEDGIQVINVPLVVRSDGTYTGSIPLVPIEEEVPPVVEDDPEFPWMILIIVLVVVMLVIAAVIVLLLARGKGGDMDVCPDCGGTMTFRDDFGTYYCEKCGGSEE